MEEERHFIRVSGDHWTFEEGKTGKCFVPLGCNYYDARTGWPPQMWKNFNAGRIRADFRRMNELGVTAIRVWVQWRSFMPQKGRLSSKALDQCRLMLSYAEKAGVKVNLTGPDFWEGTPSWLANLDYSDYQYLADPRYHDAHVLFWEQFAQGVKDEPAIYGFDLVNEPFMPWDGVKLRKLWNRWVASHYGAPLDIRSIWGATAPEINSRGEVPPPPNRKIPGSQYLVDYQRFREELATDWITKTVAAIRSVNPHHLITVGLHQSSSPFEEIVPSRYAAFNPSHLRNCLDYVSLHWYPFGNPLTASCLPFDLQTNLSRSLSMLLANCRYCYVGKPLIMEEYSYYGGGSPKFWGGVLPYRTEEEQTEFSSRLLAVSSGSLGGWLNWPFQDTKGSIDTSAYGGFYSSDGTLKTWGKMFRTLSAQIRENRVTRDPPASIIPVSRVSLLTDAEECHRILDECHRLFRDGIVWDFKIHD